MILYGADGSLHSSSLSLGFGLLPGTTDAVSAALGARFDIWAGMVVDAFGLEEDVAVCLSPEVGYGITTMSAASHQFKFAVAFRVGARLS